MPEKNLLASFANLEAAKKCQDALYAAGFDVVQVDDLDPARMDLPHAPNIQWGRYGYQPRRLDDKWTDASSWQDSHTGLIEGGAWLLTAVVPAERAADAVHIIEQYGGSL
ncbi:hypothetical protein [Sulfobacillus harzensis]|uniref:Uncharacterized protein n=1 Tax=Sulfobacillus harzensis TaxID=2729629 RepID=A0A7Y0Q1N8_9FIRM|nr:hypothetical protein [Sulfobacillus harzensis]NMP22278.1 hypothetical protein [Sulfobacillus harzensis]